MMKGILYGLTTTDILVTMLATLTCVGILGYGFIQAARRTPDRAARVDTITVSLKESPGTGYSWDVDVDRPEVVRLDCTTVTPSPEASGPEPVIGAPVTVSHSFVVEGPGAAVIEFRYRRPWEKDKPPDQVIRVGVTAKGGP